MIIHKDAAVAAQSASMEFASTKNARYVYFFLYEISQAVTRLTRNGIH